MKDCSERKTLKCPTCKLELDEKYIGERCPRCNSIVVFKSCEGCVNKNCFQK